jgi:hypothetical protein
MRIGLGSYDAVRNALWWEGIPFRATDTIGTWSVSMLTPNGKAISAPLQPLPVAPAIAARRTLSQRAKGRSSRNKTRRAYPCVFLNTPRDRPALLQPPIAHSISSTSFESCLRCVMSFLRCSVLNARSFSLYTTSSLGRAVYNHERLGC